MTDAKGLTDTLKNKIKGWYLRHSTNGQIELKEVRFDEKSSKTKDIAQKFLKHFEEKQNKEFFFPSTMRSPKEPTPAKDIDITKGISDIKTPHCPDFGYPIEIDFHDFIGIKESKNNWRTLLDLISKYPQLQRPINVLNELKRDKEVHEIK